MSVEAAHARVTRGLKDLRAHWLEVRSQWHDPVAEAFERSFFVNLEQDLRATLAGMDHLRGVLNQARHDCRQTMTQQLITPPTVPAPMPSGGHFDLQRAALNDLLQLSQRCTGEQQAIEAELQRRRAAADERRTRSERRLQERTRRLVEQDRRAATARVAELEQRSTEDFQRRRREAQAALKRLSEAAEEAKTNLKKRYEKSLWLADSVSEATVGSAENEYRLLRDGLEQRPAEIAAMIEEAEARLRLIRHRVPTGAAAIDPHDKALAGDAATALDRLVAAAQQQFAAIAGLGLSRLLRGAWPWIITACTVFVGAAGLYLVALIRFATAAPAFGYMLAAVGGAGGLILALIILAIVWAVAGTQLRRRLIPLRWCLAMARTAVDRELEQAAVRRDRRTAEARQKREQETKRAHESFGPMLTDTAERSTAEIDQTRTRAQEELAEIQRAGEAAKAAAAAQAQEREQFLTQRGAHWLALCATRHTKTLAEAQAAYDATAGALREAWTSGQARIRQMMEATRRLTAAPYRDWDDPAWQQWQPARAFPEVVRFGRLDVDLKQIAAGLPRQGQYSLELPPAFSLPALLGFPAHGSMVVEAGLEGRAAAIATLQATMTRLLTSLPPGRLRFTLIDPVGLGQSFAAFMHLTDHDEQLVGARIWTESEQISQRLVDLTNHMENVIQKYLRNEFENIDQYNAQAGELAEPYRYLVIADFPVNITDDTARRVAAILSTGARCGVFCLFGVDPRQSLPSGVTAEDLQAHAIHLTHRGGRFGWDDAVFKALPLTVDTPPAEEFHTRMLHAVGTAARDAARVEVPFEVVTPETAERWTAACDQELRVPLGRTGATRQQLLRLGKGTAQHALIAGKTGSGKSTLLHVMITNLALWYTPEQVEFYLIDFKKGVEFKTYASHRVPHARAVAIESDREFGLSVLRRLDEELRRRGALYRQHGVQELAAYRQIAGPRSLPRVLLIVDEFQEFFSEDDKIAQDAALLLDRMVRQGRAFGIHVILGSQTLSGTSGLSRSTIGQMSIRIALQCSESDSQLIFADNNSAARLLSRPGEAIYNDGGGSVEGNSPFQVAWLSDETRDKYLEQVAALAAPGDAQRPATIVFEGNADGDLTRNPRLAALLEAPDWPAGRAVPRAWLGEAVAIKDPTAVALARQSGANLLIVGQRDESAAALMGGSVISLAAQHRPGTAEFVLLDGSPADSPLFGVLPGLVKGLPYPVREIAWRDVADAMTSLAEELARRQAAQQEHSTAPALYVLIFGLQRYRVLRKQEESFAFSMNADEAPKAQPDKQLADLLREGPAVGIHTLIWIDSPASLDRTIDRQSMREFDHRVLFQMSASDSSNLIDSPIANQLGFHRALYFSEEQGVLEKFRPYAVPPAEWVAQVKARLNARKV